jgi:hypothetical protein
MKCCASPITSTAPNAGETGRDATVPAREAASQFNALLIQIAFKPLATALGFYGDLVVGTVSQTMARSERGGLTDRLERIIASAAPSRPGV